MMAYAEKTTIPLEQSIAQIVGMVKKAGAQQVGQAEGDDDRYHVWFKLADRMMRFSVPLVTEYKGPARSGNGRLINQREWIDQRNRQRGRALQLVIKAKLESVESGVETFEEAFLANIVMGGGITVYDGIKQRIALEYQEGRVTGPMLLTGPSHNGGA
jgi:hypothetical protein